MGPGWTGGRGKTGNSERGSAVVEFIVIGVGVLIPLTMNSTTAEIGRAHV